jgi:cytoskeletal protein CcmA (bactofilin family)
MTDVQINAVDEEQLDTILSEDVDFSGTLIFKKPLMIKGKLSGDIKATGDLYIGEDAVVAASIEANIVSVKGKVTGNVTAAERVELSASGAIAGDVDAPEVIMEGGSLFNGRCTMRRKQEGSNAV